ncbi:tRNA uridine-5-carboxymethylaminomethyl(34) synthesis GTPase MnmE [Mycoplasmopsis ciconiae]|uniref:tRNA modification GTPase MnmE n=1 Tax=Mycoplasmopsis ciconiae TaxID=561067 RepID=A0ABU7ML71_9BACT|nr:tRNA uridine-5-carboxymethylaminomethyl(34) synthesis GTPase MnmE [Mycoplasmopsis ciconiae]
MNDNIAAISSGYNSNQAISIVRVCGPDALEIVNKIFKGQKAKDRSISYGHIYDKDKLIDEVLVMWFIGSLENNKIVYHNYVGEPLVEINCHGGVVVTNLILELLLRNGARLAQPGEFTRRAFLNGKMDLIKAEAIHDLIFAKTNKQAQASVNRFKGKTADLIDNLSNKLAYLIGLCEVNIDYPEYNDIEVITDEDIKPKIKDLIKELKEIIRVSENSKYIFEGVNTAILGKPNVGKSSLLNALLNDDKAIVTDIAGTTRDIIEASYQVDGILFKLIDTAGLRKSDEKIENIGIEKSLKQIEKAQLIIHVIDPTQQNNEYDELIANEAKKYNKKYIKVINKKDLIIDQKNCETDEYIYTSAINNDIKELENKLIKEYSNIDIDDDKIMSNTRQISLVKSALDSLENAIEALDNYLSFDVIIVDINEAWESLQNIKGKVNREDLLDVMFKNFCLGK